MTNKVTVVFYFNGHVTNQLELGLDQKINRRDYCSVLLETENHLFSLVYLPKRWLIYEAFSGNYGLLQNKVEKVTRPDPNADGSEIPVEGAEIVVAGNAGMAMPVAAPGGTGEEQVIETVSALEQLSRCDHSCS